MAGMLKLQNATSTYAEPEWSSSLSIGEKCSLVLLPTELLEMVLDNALEKDLSRLMTNGDYISISSTNRLFRNLTRSWIRRQEIRVHAVDFVHGHKFLGIRAGQSLPKTFLRSIPRIRLDLALPIYEGGNIEQLQFINQFTSIWKRRGFLRLRVTVEPDYDSLPEIRWQPGTEELLEPLRKNSRIDLVLEPFLPSMLRRAAVDRREDIVRLIVTQSTEYARYAGERALSFAAERGSTDIVELLLKTNSLRINRKRWDSALTALGLAVYHGREEIVDALLRTKQADVWNGASVRCNGEEEYKRWTLFDLAKWTGHQPIIHRLQKAVVQGECLVGRGEMDDLQAVQHSIGMESQNHQVRLLFRPY